MNIFGQIWYIILCDIVSLPNRWQSTTFTEEAFDCHEGREEEMGDAQIPSS